MPTSRFLARRQLKCLKGGALTHFDRYRRYASSGVSVRGLRSVETNTVLVTNPGATSNSNARIVVMTATGIEARTTPACLPLGDKPSNEARPRAMTGAA